VRGLNFAGLGDVQLHHRVDAMSQVARLYTVVCQKLTNKYDTQQAGSSAFRLVLYIAPVFISSNYAADGTAIYIK